jgi:3-hydroxybutyryl-CoA dehydrogenase
LKVAVVGAGSMGAQIAQQAALHGIDVSLQDRDQSQLLKARESNRGHLARRVKKGGLAQDDADAALGRVLMATDLGEAVGDADFVIEAVFEDLELKRDLSRARLARTAGCRPCQQLLDHGHYRDRR